jgi:hypothetical protein
MLVLAGLVVAAGVAPAQSGAWADKLFDNKTSHDFGTVARGAQLQHTFTMTNIYAVPLELTQVRSSCGCVTVTPSTKVLQPRENAKVHINVDSSKFSGAKVFNVYLTVGPKYVSTATLRISANARQDVVLNPGQIHFGVVRQGQTPTQTVDVEYAGHFDWRVAEVVKNSSAPLNVKLEELYRQPAQGRQAGRVGYRLAVTLKPDAPAGPLHQELILKTNEPGSGQILAVAVDGTVQAALTVSPGVINFGKVKVGAPATQKVQVRGQRPFRVLTVDGVGDGVTVELPREAAQNHILTFRCDASKEGEIRRQVVIRTDLDGNAAVTLSLEARAEK